ncbi:metallophosphoesterase family protein, partial [Chloroflexota bacterium]
MVKLGIISDTHARTVDGIPISIRNALVDVDLIIHAGDFTHKAVLDDLKKI